jgi:hypothetical protein
MLTGARRTFYSDGVSDQHKHSPTEGIVLDEDGRDVGDRWVYCSACGAGLGIKKALPFPPEPLPAYRDQLIKVPE